MMKLSILTIPVFAAFLLVATMVTAADKQYFLTERTYKALNVAHDLMADEKYVEAETKLKALLKKTKTASYEKAVVQQTLGYLYSAQENYKQASELFQQALDANSLPEKVSHNLRYNLGQLLLADGQYNKGITLLEQWLQATTSPPNSAYILLASAYYQTKNYQKTIQYIRIAISNDKSAKEAWYQLLLAAHLELKQYKSAIGVLEKLVAKYPHQKTYWTQLSALYLQQNKDFTALAVKMLAQRLELNDAKTVINLADMYRYLQIPYKSAQLLTHAMKAGTIEQNVDNLTRLADSWLAAREGQKSANVLQQVAKLDNSGESDLKYGRVLFGLEQWQQAVKPLSKSLQKLQGKQVGTATLLLAMTHYHLGKLTKAKTLFNKAAAFENERKQAGQWLRHIENQVVDDAA